MVNKDKSITSQSLPVAPIEQMMHWIDRLPEGLSGVFGANRANNTPQIAAKNDLEAVQSWLLEYQDSPETLRSYRREAERLILWCWHHQGKALSDLNRQDIADYQRFITRPEPTQLWCGIPTPRSSPHWKPFQGGLSPSSQRQSLTILKGLFSYLRDAEYLRGNPFALIRQTAGQKHAQDLRNKKIERYLEQEDIEHIFSRYQTPEGLNDKAYREWVRERTLLYFLYYLAPRASEVANCKMNDFFQRRGRWWWRVLGKGKKYAEVPVPNILIQQIRHYRYFLGFEADPTPEDNRFFIRSTKGTNGISPNMVYRLSKKILIDTSIAIEADYPEAAARMRKASTHWFRHTAITHWADKGMDLRLVSKTARHNQLETTAIYFHAEDEAWHDAVNFSGKNDQV